MAEPITLDKTIYETFETLPKADNKITVVQLARPDAVTTFSEFTGTVEASTTDSVTFTNDIAFRYIIDGVVAVDTIIHMRILTLDNQHVYLWRNHTGDAAGPLSVSSPTRGGKSRRKRKSRKSKLKYRKNGTR